MSPFTSRSKLKRLYAGEALPLERSFQLSESLGITCPGFFDSSKDACSIFDAAEGR